MENVKLCKNCNIVKPIEKEFYKAGKSYQKYCKICHNKKRNTYKNTSNYVKKGTGFNRLDEDLRNKIIYDIYVKTNFREIAKKYDGIKYQTLLIWNRKNQIPLYSDKCS